MKKGINVRIRRLISSQEVLESSRKSQFFHCFFLLRDHPIMTSQLGKNWLTNPHYKNTQPHYTSLVIIDERFLIFFEIFYPKKSSRFRDLLLIWFFDAVDVSLQFDKIESGDGGESTLLQISSTVSFKHFTRMVKLII